VQILHCSALFILELIFCNNSSGIAVSLLWKSLIWNHFFN
jgi:hypothetical protein